MAFVKVRFAVTREVRYGYRGQRVGEASHPGPVVVRGDLQTYENPVQPKHGWQKFAARATHEDRVARMVWPMTSPERALWRSPKGPLACSAFMVFPTSTRIDPQPFLTSTSHCFSPPVLANVAVSSTAVATIKLSARRRGSGSQGFRIGTGDSAGLQRKRETCFESHSEKP